MYFEELKRLVPIAPESSKEVAVLKRSFPDASLDPRSRLNRSIKACQSSSGRRLYTKPERVILIGPPGLYEEGLQQILKGHNFNILGRSSALADLDPALSSKARIIIITDASEAVASPQAVAALRNSDPALRFVLLVNTRSQADVNAALQVPAHAFLCQKIGCEALMNAIDVVLGDGAVLSIEVMSHLLQQLTDFGDRQPQASPATTSATVEACRILSDREVDVLRCLTDGASNKIIARRFQIAESTVKIHVKGILRKINVQNRTQAAIWALAQMPMLGRAAHEVVPGE